jgi:multidrug efflux pump subunit AcrA (membrane-fusion protein)
MPHFSTLYLSRAPRRALLAPTLAAAALLALAAQPLRAAENDPLKTEAITVIKAAKACFADIVEVSGTIYPRDETSIRPERLGSKVAEILAEPSESVTAGQTLARLTLPDGSIANVTAPVSGIVAASTAVIGAMASAKGEALFSIIARGEYDLIGLVPTEDIGKLAVNQPSSIAVIGTGNVDGKVRRIAPTVEPNSQLGQVIIAITANNTGRRLFVNASGRALIKTGQSCNVAVPLTAVQYGSAGTVVQVVRRQRIETHRVETGLISGGAIEIREGLNEGDDVVARAGALLREGDPVRPVQEKVSSAGR